VLLAALVAAGAADAAVTVARAEVSGSRLRIEGRALANRTITVDGRLHLRRPHSAADHGASDHR
jgi:hypothetical protein